MKLKYVLAYDPPEPTPSKELAKIASKYRKDIADGYKLVEVIEAITPGYKNWLTYTNLGNKVAVIKRMAKMSRKLL